MSEQYADHSGRQITRRHLLRAGAGMAGAVGALSAGLVDLGAAAASAAPRDGHGHGGVSNASVQNAYLFLNTMMDAYAQGATPRLAQSYSDQQGLNSTAFVYDNALQIIAYLARGSSDDVTRATVLGNSLLYAQQHDPNFTDGRLRDSYFVAPSLVNTDGTVQLDGAPAFITGTAVGNVAWAGLALVRLSRVTGNQSFLSGAVQLGNWIVANAYDTRGAGGFTGGFDPNQNKFTYKSTEHNIDTYALFTLLAQFTNNGSAASGQSWVSLARYALTFIQSMWDASTGHFWTGTNPDGVTINPSPIPEDVQTWSFLALGNPAYAASLDWASTHIAVTDTPASFNTSLSGNVSFSGVSFSDVSLTVNPFVAPNSFTPQPDPSAVWFEGTAHIADALLFRNAASSTTVLGDDSDLASYYLANIQQAQARLGQGQTVGGVALPTGYGVVASSSPFDTGFGFDYFPHLHIGATSWYLIAAQQVNPYTVKAHGQP